MLVAQYQTVSQFEPDESAFECGPFAVALNKFAGRNGPTGSPEDIDQLADRLWQKYGGGQGIGMQQLFDMMHDVGLHYQTIGSTELHFQVDQLTPAVAMQWLHKGYPVICSVAETSVYDLDLRDTPYHWTPTGYHIITLAGISEDGNFLVSDPASVPANQRPFPRRYLASRLAFVTMVAVILPGAAQPQGVVDDMGITIDLSDPIVARYFSQTPDGQWKCKQTGFLVQKGMLEFYRSFGQKAYCGLTYLGLPLSNETPVAGHPGVVRQQFERAILAYDPNHVLDQPPGALDIYLVQNR